MHEMTLEADNPLVPGHIHIQLVSKEYSGFEEILDKSPGIHPFDIEDFLDSARNPEIAEKLKKHGFFQAVEQKIHGDKQILKPEEIKKGMKLLLRHNDEVMGEIVVTSEPYQDEAAWKVDCEGIQDGNECSYIFLSDHGVSQYPNRLWNAWNWLQKSPK